MVVQPIPKLSLTSPFLPTLYKLCLHVEPARSAFTGVVDISLTKRLGFIPRLSTHRGGFSITLHACDLIISKAIVSQSNFEAEATVKYDRPNQLVTLSLDPQHKIDYNSQLHLKISYTARISFVSNDNMPTPGLFKTSYTCANDGELCYVLTTHMQPCLARTVFPCIDEPSAKAKFDISITTSSKHTVLSVMTIKNEEIIQNENNLVNKGLTMKRTTFNTTPIMSTNVFGFVIGDFDLEESKNTRVPIRLYRPKGTDTSGTVALEAAVELFEPMEKTLGLRYPLQKLDIVASMFLDDGAVETWGLITVKYGSLLTIKNQEPDLATKLSIKQIISHEMVHQWIGNLVSFDWWDSIWLNESLSTFITNYLIKIIEEKNLKPKQTLPSGKDPWVAFMEDMEAAFVADASIDSSPIQSENVLNTNEGNPALFNAVTYRKGICLLRMVSSYIEADPYEEHPQKFFKGITNYLNRFRYKSAKPIDLWNIIDQTSNTITKTFMRSWASKPGFPVINVEQFDDKLVLTQHRFITGHEDHIKDEDDEIYAIPLTFKTKSKGVKRQVFFDRTIELPIRREDFIKLNLNQTGFYRVHYNTETLINIGKSFNKGEISVLDIIGVINEAGKFLGTAYGDTLGFMSLIETIKDTMDKSIWCYLLAYIQNLENALIFESEEVTTKFRQWKHNLIDPMLKSYDWSVEALSDETRRKNIDPIETKLKIMLVSTGMDTEFVSEFATKLYKAFSEGNKYAIPLSLLKQVFAAIVYNGKKKEWKHMQQLARTNVTGDERIYNAAMTALGYVQTPLLVQKTLHFVMENLNKHPHIEICCVGMQFRAVGSNGLWEWFVANYEKLYNKAYHGSQMNLTTPNNNGMAAVQDISFIAMTAILSDNHLTTFRESLKMPINENMIEQAKAYIAPRLVIMKTSNEILQWLNDTL